MLAVALRLPFCFTCRYSINSFYMYFRYYILISLFFICSCARQGYFQQDALYTSTSSPQTDIASPQYYLVTAGKHYKKNKIHQLFWGKHYREVWATPVKAPAIDLNSIKGGLHPVELGGGLQSTSLSLRDKQGHLFTMRTLDKDPAKSISPFFRKTFLANLMRDQTSAINPYAAFVVPTLAEAAQLYHTNPELYYVPKQNAGLGKFSEPFGGKVVMLEEKFTVKESLTVDFGKATDLVNTETFLQNRFSSPDYSLNQLAFAQARLFDVLILDWDRHDGQWNWAAMPAENTPGIIYEPVPKDRDQAFYRYDGFIPWLTTRKILTQPFKILRHNRQDVAGLIYKARFLDERLLNEITKPEWLRIANSMQASLTDEVLMKAVAAFPEPVQKKAGASTLELLQKRRDKIPTLAAKMYALLARKVTIAGTDEKELFRVTRSDEKTLVQVFSVSDNTLASQLFYEREFSASETKEITLRGLGQDDEFIVEGQARKSPLLIIYGDKGQDKITDTSEVKGLGKKTVVYDNRSATTLQLGPESKNKTSDKVEIKEYERIMP